MNSRSEQRALEDAQAHPFDPYHLRPLASLNRRRLIALPGLDEHDVGKAGWELLSNLALIKLIRSHARALQLEGTRRGAVEIEFVHDCDVAACALAGRPSAAVLMLGSALGVGFVPPAEGHRPLAERFALEQSQDISIGQPGGGR